jgi:lipopolysaccharide transport system permease protein
MSVHYERPRTTLDAGTRRVRVAFGVGNDSDAPWRASEGFAIGYHLLDAETGTLIVDGPRALPSAEIGAGSVVETAVEFELPPEDGRYQVLVSPMREGECWYYERGWRFVLVEARVENGAARIEGTRVATAASLRLRSLMRSAGRALVYPFLTVWRNRGLIRAMVRRDVLGRYRGSFGGVFWTVFNPLLLMLTYFFVFGVVLRSRFEGDPSRTGFALYFLAGMLPWLAFSEAAGRAPGVMMEHRNFVKKLVFEVETLPFNLVASGLVSQFFAIALYLAGLALARGGVPASALWLPVLLVPQVMFTAGVAWFLAALGVFFRDLGQINGFLLTLWFFLTPICYPETSLPPEAMALLSKNPLFALVRAYRDILLEGRAPSWSAMGKLWLVSAAVLVLGHAWFYKLRKSFADII